MPGCHVSGSLPRTCLLYGFMRWTPRRSMPSQVGGTSQETRVHSLDLYQSARPALPTPETDIDIYTPQNVHHHAGTNCLLFSSQAVFPNTSSHLDLGHPLVSAYRIHLLDRFQVDHTINHYHHCAYIHAPGPLRQPCIVSARGITTVGNASRGPPACTCGCSAGLLATFPSRRRGGRS